MRRLNAVLRAGLGVMLALTLVVSLAACSGTQRPTETPVTPDAPNAPGSAGGVETPAAPATAPLTISKMDVEFSVGARDVDALLQLQKDFPQALITVLDKQQVKVDAVNVTFGTSGEATETALRSGAVQLAFLSAEDYYPYRSGMIVAAERGETPDLSLGLVVAAVSEDADADERLAEALRRALPDLADVLAGYTAPYANGIYVYDAASLEQLAALYDKETQAAELTSAAK